MKCVKILNPSGHRWLSIRHAVRMVRNQKAKWARGSPELAIWLIVEREQLRSGYTAGTLPTARLHELDGLPVVAAGRLLGMGSRSAGPPPPNPYV